MNKKMRMKSRLSSYKRGKKFYLHTLQNNFKLRLGQDEFEREFSQTIPLTKQLDSKQLLKLQIISQSKPKGHVIFTLVSKLSET